MLQTIFLLQAVNQNLLLGIVPESLGLLIFGVGLIGLTFGLRWILNRVETPKIEQKSKKLN